jgi:hypothetical protein
LAYLSLLIYSRHGMVACVYKYWALLINSVSMNNSKMSPRFVTRLIVIRLNFSKSLGHEHGVGTKNNTVWTNMRRIGKDKDKYKSPHNMHGECHHLFFKIMVFTHILFMNEFGILAWHSWHTCNS